MMNIKPGDLFIYQVNENYGVIQVIEKSKNSGYNVRIFCDLIDRISDDLIDIITQSNRFYFIKDFYSNDLLKSNHITTRFLDTKISMPKYMRSSERKVNGTIVWYIIDVNKGKIVKKLNLFNEELIDLSPADTWGIEYIKKRWSENFDLKKWNNTLLDNWYLNYLKLYEPDKHYKFNISKVKNYSLLEKWNNEKKISKEIINLLEELINKLVNDFSDDKNLNLSKDKYLKHFIIELNKLNDKFNFIHTVESEELIEYIHYILSINNITDDNDIVDKYRNW